MRLVVLYLESINCLRHTLWSNCWNLGGNSQDTKRGRRARKPIALGFFGGVIDYNKMGFIARKGMEFFKPQLEKDGFKVAPDIYDLRNWDEIRN